VLLIDSHTGTLTGNALGLALAAQSAPDFLPACLGNRSAPLQSEIPTWPGRSRIAWLLRKRADIVAFTGYVPSKYATDWSGALRLFLWHGMPIEVGGFARARALFHEHPRGGAGQRVLAALRERLKQPVCP
jgi:hypothetical protein